jgi:hypothetical protein
MLNDAGLPLVLGTKKCREDLLRLDPHWALLHWSRRLPGIYAGDVLAVEFWNDPDVSVDTLSAGVELDQKCPGRSVVLFTD